MPFKDPTLPENIEAARAARRKHYEKNKQRYIKQAKAYRGALRQWVRDLKDQQPCTDCGVRYPYYVLQYDHIGDDKVADINTLSGLGSKKKLEAELAKCELVCANCHAERTHSRLSL